MVEYEDMERAYQNAVIGSKAPVAFVASGALIIAQWSGWDDVIDPKKMYYVTNDSIVEVEDDA